MSARITAPTSAVLTDDWATANALYLELHLRRLRALIVRRVRWLRQQWSHDPRREFAAQVISEAHADWLLRGEDRQEEQAFYATDDEALHAASVADAAEGEIKRLLRTQGNQAPAMEVLQHLFRLTAFERDVLLLCLAPEIDPSFGPLYAYAQDNMALHRPTPHLALDLAGCSAAERVTRLAAFGETAPLRRYRLLYLADGVLSIDERVGEYLRGHNRPDEALATLLRPIYSGLLSERQRRLVTTLVAQVRARRAGGEWPMVNLAGLPDSGQSELAHHLCDRLGVQLYRLDLARLESEVQRVLPGLLERETLLLQIALYVDLSATLTLEGGQRALLDDLAGRGGLFVIVATREPWRAERETIALPMARLRATDNIDLWRQALGAEHTAAAGLDALVQQFDFGPQAVARTVAVARQQAQLMGRELAPADLWAAGRETTNAELDELAQRIEPHFDWDDIVVPAGVHQHLREIAAQVEQRHTVYESWGFGAALSRGRGISALFAGPSGTGKTMAAEVLARHLGLALYRIDLASMVSKYIGETEKNIRRLFDAAERRGAILFFDEADALFGKRAEVKDSHDRFANLEINYLLQRMESYWGLAILATNRPTALDRAFLRRLRFVVEFEFPDADTRRRIWQKVFPAQTPLDELDYGRLARLEVAGGSISNIAVNAAFLAASNGGRVGMAQIIKAARREFAKIDKLLSEAEFSGEEARP